MPAIQTAIMNGNAKRAALPAQLVPEPGELLLFGEERLSRREPRVLRDHRMILDGAAGDGCHGILLRPLGGGR